jgi:ParB-like chromosome segregation protein Spo0J
MIRNRIRELRHVKASLLRPNPKNWRTHPARQREVLRGLLAEIGYADALLARELPDGALELIDGHLRAGMIPDEEVPVLVLDLSAAEADKLLALHDPLAAMAETDFEALTNLVSQVETENAEIQRTLDRLATRGGAGSLAIASDEPETEIAPLFQIVVQCDDEQGQRQLYERLKSEGYACRLLNL